MQDMRPTPGCDGGWWRARRVGLQGAVFVGLLITATSSPAWVNWETYVSVEDGFSVRFPTPPIFFDVLFGTKSESIAAYHRYTASADVESFSVDVVQFEPAVHMVKTDSALLAAAVDRAAGAICHAGEYREIETSGRLSHDVVFECPDEWTRRIRFIIVDGRLYQVEVSGGPDVAINKSAERFLNSFRLAADGAPQ